MSTDDEGATQLVVKALYNFNATGDDELSFQKGDLIMVTKVCMSFVLLCVDLLLSWRSGG